MIEFLSLNTTEERIYKKRHIINSFIFKYLYKTPNFSHVSETFKILRHKILASNSLQLNTNNGVYICRENADLSTKFGINAILKHIREGQVDNFDSLNHLRTALISSSEEIRNQFPWFLK